VRLAGAVATGENQAAALILAAQFVADLIQCRPQRIGEIGASEDVGRAFLQSRFVFQHLVQLDDAVDLAAFNLFAEDRDICNSWEHCHPSLYALDLR
jgi:hypothetical protein